MASSFTYAESSLYGSDVEHFVSRRNQTGKTNDESSITTEVHYFRNRTNDDGSTALISVISNEPLRANSTDLKVGTTKFAVTKFVEDGESRVVSTFISEESSSSSSSSSPSCISSLSESAKKYITECIFKQFSNDNEELFRIDGTCEIFCPMNGTNTGWHRDGFQSGCYIGHALFEEEEEKGTAAWFEFALIPEQTVSDSRDYGTSSIDFCDRDHLLVHPSNFVACASRNAISVFEDQKILHRSPRVKSCWDAMERGRRKIARFDFVGRDAENNVVLWQKPPKKGVKADVSLSSPPRTPLAELRGRLREAVDFSRYVTDASSRPSQ